MSARRSAVVLLVVGVGAALGYATAYAVDPPTAGIATPLPASSPSVPGDPPIVRAPDPLVAPLETDLELARSQVGTIGFEIGYPRPKGWRRTDSSPVETQWVRPGNPSYTYKLRVEHVFSERQSMAAMVETRALRLDAETQQFVEVGRTDDSLEYTYLDDGHLRYSLLRWLDVNDRGVAELEISLTGREVDVPGMRALLDAMVAGVR